MYNLGVGLIYGSSSLVEKDTLVLLQFPELHYTDQYDPIICIFAVNIFTEKRHPGNSDDSHVRILLLDWLVDA